MPEFACRCYLKGQTEIVVPTGPGNLTKALSVSGPRLHHVAYKVPSSQSLLSVRAELMDLGFNFLLEPSIKGMPGYLINFIMPEGRGVLVELVQELTDA